MRAKFILFAQGRTGSTLLGDLLRSNSEVFFGDEILATRVASPRLRVEAMRWRHARHAAGFHVKIYQLTEEQGVSDVGAWLRGMHQSGWRMVALRRENLLRHVLSNMTAIATDSYHDRSGAGDAVKLHVEPDHLIHWMTRRQQVGVDEAAALAGVPHLALTYERDLQDSATWAATTSRLFAHLDLPAVDVATNLRRTNVGALSDLITNYAEIKSALTGTEFAQYLD